MAQAIKYVSPDCFTRKSFALHQPVINAMAFSGVTFPHERPLMPSPIHLAMDHPAGSRFRSGVSLHSHGRCTDQRTPVLRDPQARLRDPAPRWCPNLGLLLVMTTLYPYTWGLPQ
jgi:hypothetical protein